MAPDPRIAVCPGSYDPITNGHLDVIARTSQLFDEVVVGVVDHPVRKSKTLFETEERLAFILEATAQPEADDGLGGRHDHDGEREDLAGPVARVAREGDQGEVARVQHDLEREQHDERAAADEDAEGARCEEQDRDDEVRGDARAGHGP